MRTNKKENHGAYYDIARGIGKRSILKRRMHQNRHRYRFGALF
jgi:hypothetical protein